MDTATPGNSNAAVSVEVYINEYLAQNTPANPTAIVDPADGNYEDWIELYNAGSTPANLGGYFMSDDLQDRNKWEIPAGTIIPPNGFLRIWADEDPEQNDAQNVHADFRLGQNGESIGLYTPDLFTVDELTFGIQVADRSEGRFPDGSANIQALTAQTPGAPNTVSMNNPPTIDPVSDKTVNLGDSLSFTIIASDPDVPLIYSLDMAPGGATIGSGSGLFSWTPLTGPAVHTVVVRVTDNGSPARSSTETFTITVVTAPPVSISRSGNQITLSFATQVGKHYRIDYKNALTDPGWTELTAAFEATMTTHVINDTVDGRASRYYRLVQLD
jgi:hypothetical protein